MVFCEAVDSCVAAMKADLAIFDSPHVLGLIPPEPHERSSTRVIDPTCLHAGMELS
jgi:hypothetical protein